MSRAGAEPVLHQDGGALRAQGDRAKLLDLTLRTIRGARARGARKARGLDRDGAARLRPPDPGARVLRRDAGAFIDTLTGSGI